MRDLVSTPLSSTPLSTLISMPPSRAMVRRRSDGAMPRERKCFLLCKNSCFCSTTVPCLDMASDLMDNRPKPFDCWPATCGEVRRRWTRCGDASDASLLPHLSLPTNLRTSTISKKNPRHTNVTSLAFRRTKINSCIVNQNTVHDDCSNVTTVPALATTPQLLTLPKRNGKK